MFLCKASEDLTLTFLAYKVLEWIKIAKMRIENRPEKGGQCSQKRTLPTFLLGSCLQFLWFEAILDGLCCLSLCSCLL